MTVGANCFSPIGAGPLCADKLREKQLHPLLDTPGIPRAGFHSLRHGAASALLADGATPAVVQRQLRHSDPRITLGIYGHVIGDQQRTKSLCKASELASIVRKRRFVRNEGNNFARIN